MVCMMNFRKRNPRKPDEKGKKMRIINLVETISVKYNRKLRIKISCVIIT